MSVSSYERTRGPRGLALPTTPMIALGLGIALGVFITLLDAPLQAGLGLIGLLGAIFIIRVPVYGLAVLAFVTHANLSTVLQDFHGLPPVATPLFLLLLLGVAINLFIKRESPRGVVPLLIFFAIFAASQILAMTQSLNPEISDKMILQLGKDALIAALLVLLLKNMRQYRIIVWALLLSGALSGTIALLQHLTGTFEHTYWGFGLAPKHDIVNDIKNFRFSGAYGDPNFFALFQFVLIPLAIDRLWTERSLLLKTAACYTLGAILVSVFFSYSRGAVVGIIGMAGIFILLNPRRIWIIPTAVILALVIVQFTPQSRYINRMLTVEYLSPLKKNTVFTDDSFDGRKSEMISAALMLRDHPLLGVGPGCYEDNYQDYAREVHLDFRLEDRQAHSRYLELLAETGILGFSAFCLLLYGMLRGLNRARRITGANHLTALNHSVTGLLLSMLGMLIGIVFLHDAWQRFFWLLVGLCFAMPNIIRHELAERGKDQIAGSPSITLD